jgi:hypothetical protein
MNRMPYYDVRLEGSLMLTPGGTCTTGSLVQVPGNMFLLLS